MKITKQELLDALTKLGPQTEADWTADGLPSVERVADLTLDNTVTREDITVNALGFCREVAEAALKARQDVSADDAARAEAAKPLGKASSDAKASQDEVVAAMEQHPDTRRQALQAAVTAAKDDLAAFDEAMAKARIERDKMVQVVDEATRALEAEFPPLRPADAVRAWLDSEHQKRLDRSGGPSELDRKFVRQTGYGNRRPAVPPVSGSAAA